MNKRITILLALLFVSGAALADKGFMLYNHLDHNIKAAAVEAKATAEPVLEEVTPAYKDKITGKLVGHFFPTIRYGKRAATWIDGHKLYTTAKYDFPDEIHIYDNGQFQVTEKTVLGKTEHKIQQAKEEAVPLVGGVVLKGMEKKKSSYGILGLLEGADAKKATEQYEALYKSEKNKTKLGELTKAYSEIMSEKMKSEKTQYEILGVKKGASVAEVEKAYKNICLKYTHEGRDPSAWELKILEAASMAYQVIRPALEPATKPVKLPVTKPMVPTKEGRPKVEPKPLEYVGRNRLLNTWKQTECPICLEGLTAKDTNLVQLSCHHICHKECIDRWFETTGTTDILHGGGMYKKKSTCPCCRAEVKQEYRPYFKTRG